MFKFLKSLILIIVILALAGFVFYTYQITASVSRDTENVDFIIQPGEGVNQISRNLSDQGLIRSSFYFEVYAWQKNLEHRFKSGVHQLSPSMNIKDIVAKLTTPGGSETNITIIEGWSNKEIADYLEQKELGTADDFLKLVGRNLGSFTADYDFLADKPASADLEGYLFPDTYRIFKNADQAEVVRKMLDNFDLKLTEQMRADIKARGRSVFEVVTLASIIEKEVRDPEDMKKVADIFYKRLEAGIALQSDATVNYVTGNGRVQPTLADTKVDSPYNTYKYRGLPPSPIANPGLNALKAAIYPEANPYYYFLTTPTGEVIYSKTYEEHLENKTRYLD
jgi:UPF0755 protein